VNKFRISIRWRRCGCEESYRSSAGCGLPNFGRLE
jgi:hypothetical protein